MLFISPPFGNYINLPYTTRIRGSFTYYPRLGIIHRILQTLRYSTEYNGWINNIGLRNKGIHYGLKKYKPNDIISIAITKKEEVNKFMECIPENTNLELNISCPNTDEKLIYEDINRFLNPCRKWCIIKLSPINDNSLIDNLVSKGFNQFHCCNTLPIKGRGGLSGPTLIPYVSEKVKYIRNNYPNSIIIAGGGIRQWENIDKYKENGADHYAIGTILFNPFLFTKFYFTYLSKKFNHLNNPKH